jgi:hypothetical protein
MASVRMSVSSGLMVTDKVPQEMFVWNLVHRRVINMSTAPYKTYTKDLFLRKMWFEKITN